MSAGVACVTAVYEAVRRWPGLRSRDLAVRAGYSRSSTQHALRVLVEIGSVRCDSWHYHITDPADARLSGIVLDVSILRALGRGPMRCADLAHDLGVRRGIVEIRLATLTRRRHVVHDVTYTLAPHVAALPLAHALRVAPRLSHDVPMTSGDLAAFRPPLHLDTARAGLRALQSLGYARRTDDHPVRWTAV